MKTAVVTGATSGIGAATMKALQDRGFTVIGTSRKQEGFHSLDLTSADSIAAFAAEVGPVDVLINNAGESQSGALEELPMDAVERLFALNVLGPVHLTQLLLPGMRERGYGRVVMVGSMLASFPLAYRSSYVSTKAAIKGFATAARFETSPFGVWFTTVEPGSINTGISERRTKYVADGSPYAADFATMLARLDRNERTGISAGRVAATIVAAVEAERPRPLYAVGSRAPLAFTVRRVVPRAVAEKIIARTHGLSR